MYIYLYIYIYMIIKWLLCINIEHVEFSLPDTCSVHVYVHMHIVIHAQDCRFAVASKGTVQWHHFFRCLNSLKTVDNVRTNTCWNSLNKIDNVINIKHLLEFPEESLRRNINMVLEFSQKVWNVTSNALQNSLKAVYNWLNGIAPPQSPPRKSTYQSCTV